MAIAGPFYISFERSGGVAGISSKVEIDSKSLTAEEAAKIRQLIKDSGYFEFKKTDNLSKDVPDQFQYTITIAYDGNRKTVTLNEGEIPESFRPLINYLTRKARGQGKP